MPRQENGLTSKSFRWFLIALMVLVVLFTLQQNRKGGLLGESDKPLQYPEFICLIQDHKIKSGKIVKDRFEGEYIPQQRPITATSDEFTFVLPASPEAQSKIIDLLNANRVPFEIKPPILSDWMQGLIFSIMLPILFIAVIWIVFIRQAQSGGNQALSFGRSRAKRLTDNVPKVTFEDVAGVDEAKQERSE